MKTLFTLFLLLLNSTAFGQRLAPTSTTFLGGNTFNKFTDAPLFLPDSDGGFTITGYSTDPGSGDVPPNPTGLGQIFFSFSPAGVKRSTQLVPTQWGAGRMVRTPDGNYVCLSLSLDSLTYTDILLYKMTPTGTILWQKKWGSTGQEHIMDLISTSDGGFLILGATRGRDGDIPYNRGPVQTFPSADCVVIKTDSMGNKQWLKILGTSGDEETVGKLLADGKGSYYMTASTIPKDFEFADFTTYPQGTGGYCNFLVHLDTLGNLIYSKCLGVGGVSSALYDTTDSTVVVTGYSGGNTFVLPPYTQFHGDADAAVLKVKAETGNVVWAKLYGTANQELGKSISFGPNGTYVVAASREGYNWPAFPRELSIDVQMTWIGRDGSLLDSALIGGNTSDNPNALYFTGKQLYLVGNTQSPGFHLPNAATNPYGTNGVLFLSKFDFWPASVPAFPKAEEAFKVYPNPTTGTLNVALPAAQGTLSLINSAGQVVKQWNVSTKMLEVQTGEQVSGNYILRWQPATAQKALTASVVIR